MTLPPRERGGICVNMGVSTRSCGNGNASWADVLLQRHPPNNIEQPSRLRLESWCRQVANKGTILALCETSLRAVSSRQQGNSTACRERVAASMSFRRPPVEPKAAKFAV